LASQKVVKTTGLPRGFGASFDALAAFIKTHSGILIVVNKSRETVGLISLSDIVNKLFGRSIDNVFDSYGSARDVAAQK
jgi:CBS domain containing-hemolysin-like protein